MNRLTGMSLVVAAALFWAAWVLMPGVGIVDPRAYLRASSPRSADWCWPRWCCSWSRPPLYAPGVVGLVADSPLGGQRGGADRSATLLAVGAMGSAADAVLHLLAFAMTAPGLDPEAQVAGDGVHAGPGLGCWSRRCCWRSSPAGRGCRWRSARAGLVSRWNVRAHPAGAGRRAVGGALAGGGAPPLGLASSASPRSAWSAPRRRGSASPSSRHAFARTNRVDRRALRTTSSPPPRAGAASYERQKRNRHHETVVVRSRAVGRGCAGVGGVADNRRQRSGLAAHPHHGRRRPRPGLRAADRQLGRPAAPGGLRRGGAQPPRRRRARARAR